MDSCGCLTLQKHRWLQSKMAEELLIANKQKFEDKIKFKITDKKRNGWSPNKYLKIISNKDPTNLAFLLYDLKAMGYPVDKAFERYKSFIDEPNLWFLK